MDDGEFGFEEVTVEFTEEVIESLDEKAFVYHRDNRAAAIRDCLDEWIKQQSSETNEES